MAVAPVRSIKDVVTDFLASAPTVNEIAAYRLPDMLQDYAHYLLERNRHGELSAEERADMEEFRQIDHLLTLLKAKARLKIQQPNTGRYPHSSETL